MRDIETVEKELREVSEQLAKIYFEPHGVPEGDRIPDVHPLIMKQHRLWQELMFLRLEY